jgi:hypothetical protein
LEVSQPHSERSSHKDERTSLFFSLFFSFFVSLVFEADTAKRHCCIQDAYIRAALEGITNQDVVYHKEEETDTHWRARKGKAEFNVSGCFQ